MSRLMAISDLHVRYPENRRIVEELIPGSPDDWLIVAGDVGDFLADVRWALRALRERWSTIIWVPGNHELWTPTEDPVRLRGEERYAHLVDICRSLDIVTPEDPYPVWHGEGGPVTIAPLFVLYDYTFRLTGASTAEEALREAYAAGIVCTDEFLLHPDPYPSRDAWCRARVESTTARLDAIPSDMPTVLVNHFPLVRDPTLVLRHPEFAIWCGTDATADWHLRYRAEAVVYGHLHIPRTIEVDGVPHIEVSLGYPREWQPRPAPPGRPVRILPRGPGR